MFGGKAGVSSIHRMLVFLVCFACSSSLIARGETALTDTIPPSFSWVSPTAFSVITTNTVRIAVDARDNPGGSGIEKVRFYASYLNDNSISTEMLPIGEVSDEPYEIIWDCSRIPDQNFWKLRISCTVTDRAGNAASLDRMGRAFNSSIVLDRNPALKSSALRSFRTRTGIRIDGSLTEWALPDSTRFANNDNTVTVYSVWDSQYLYFGIRVTDQSIIGIHTPESEDIDAMPSEDIAEVYLDTRHDHSAIFADPCRHYLISAAGKFYEERTFLDRAKQTYNPGAILHPPISGNATVRGTLNVEGDIDHWYTAELAIPWSELGIKPRSGKIMGLEVWNSDRDYRSGRSSYAGWTTTAPNLKNPSEWGDLVLVDDRSAVRSIMVFSFPALLGLVGLFLFYSRHRRQRATVTEPPAAPEENGHIRKARLYIEEHYQEDALSREDIAHHVGLNASYFGKLFKAETGEYLSDYLVSVRIEKAKRLLLTTEKNISEIAFTVGFNSQSYFGYIFKKKEHCSPKEFRASRR